MKHKVLRKQENSKDCLVCGLQNPYGLKASFYELENNELVAIFEPHNHLQSYPGRLHGGISGAMLDETIGRAIMIQEPNLFGVTVELSLKYKKPVPLNVPLKVVGRITNVKSRTFEGSGEIILEDGEVAVTATGKYFKMPIDKISDMGTEDMDWEVFEGENDPEHFDY